METEPRCPSCGRSLSAGAPQGLCPECLMKAGFATGEAPAPGGPTQRPRFVPPALDKLAPLFPQLEILQLLGQGGMGAVYKARQTQLDRVVALKILPPGIGDDPAFAERFTREARALAKLNHPSIVTLYEFGQSDGLFYFLMEFVDGVNLRQLLPAGRLASREALAIVPQICDALQYAHDEGIVHRDIKPENILLDRRGRGKVADFGLAKLVGRDANVGQTYLAAGSGDFPAASSSGSNTGLESPVNRQAGKPALPAAALTGERVMGTPNYMAPEQVERPSEVDHRADIYALGVVFYQMLTGELPGQTIEPPSKKIQLDVRLDEVVLRALEKEPERRYQQASQVKSDVEAIAGSQGTAGSAERIGASPTGAAPVAGPRQAPGKIASWSASARSRNHRFHAHPGVVLVDHVLSTENMGVAQSSWPALPTQVPSNHTSSVGDCCHQSLECLRTVASGFDLGQRWGKQTGPWLLPQRQLGRRPALSCDGDQRARDTSSWKSDSTATRPLRRRRLPTGLPIPSVPSARQPRTSSRSRAYAASACPSQLAIEPRSRHCRGHRARPSRRISDPLHEQSDSGVSSAELPAFLWADKRAGSGNDWLFPWRCCCSR